MRLLYVHERIGALGGAEANVLVTAAEMQRRGHTLGLVHGSGTDQGEAEWQEVFSQRFRATNSAEVAALPSAVARFRPDVVFMHKFSTPAVLHALLTCGRPIVRMVHDHDLYCMRGYKYNYFTRHICQRPASAFCVFPCGASVGRASGSVLPFRWVSYQAKRREIALNKAIPRLIVASDYMKSELLRNGFGVDQIEVHPPVPRSAQVAATSSFSARNLIVYAGQIIRGKGVDVLLESLARVTTPFECVILGDGAQRLECERISQRLGLHDRVRFAGFVPQTRIADHYRDASLAVMSSLWPEPFGATGLEAMRCGLPVVAFDSGGIREWLLDGVNGFLVPWMDRGTFARRVETLLNDKSLARRLGDDGRAIADRRFNFEAYIDGLENLFNRTASHTPALDQNLQSVSP